MLRKSILLLVATLVVGLANEYLVRVELTSDRLTPLADQGLKVIAELEHSAFVLINEVELDKLATFAYTILDKDPKEGNYYLVQSLDRAVDLTTYGTLLTRDGDDYLIKLGPGMLEELIKHKVRVKRILFTPLIIKSDASLLQLNTDPTVQEMVDQVHPDSVLSHVQRLQDFVSRYSTFDSCFAAANYIANKFISYGCDSVFTQTFLPDHAPNVVGVKRGVKYPDSIYTIVCGHFDATSEQAPWIAPGADDNASGTVAAIEAARVMKDYDFEYSIRYIGFAGEEFGLLGSQHYAYYARLAGDSILAVFNADMIAYTNNTPESLDVVAKISNPACEPLADFFIAAADSYTTLLTRKEMTDWAPYSDHAPFWDFGYKALLCIEDDPPNNPYYHLTSDTIGAGYGNNAFCTEAIRAHVAALALMAVPSPVGIEDGSRVVSGGTVLSVYPTIGAAFAISLKNTESDAILSIYDATGTKVQTLDASPQSSVIWSGTDHASKRLPAGVYFVTFDGNESKQTEKITLLR